MAERRGPCQNGPCPRQANFMTVFALQNGEKIQKSTQRDNLISVMVQNSLKHLMIQIWRKDLGFDFFRKIRSISRLVRSAAGVLQHFTM